MYPGVDSMLSEQFPGAAPARCGAGKCYSGASIKSILLSCTDISVYQDPRCTVRATAVTEALCQCKYMCAVSGLEEEFC